MTNPTKTTAKTPAPRKSGELPDEALDKVAGGGVNLVSGPEPENYRENGVAKDS